MPMYRLTSGQWMRTNSLPIDSNWRVTAKTKKQKQKKSVSISKNSDFMYSRLSERNAMEAETSNSSDQCYIEPTSRDMLD